MQPKTLFAVGQAIAPELCQDNYIQMLTLCKLVKPRRRNAFQISPSTN